mgnify:CR=1 FL=1
MAMLVITRWYDINSPKQAIEAMRLVIFMRAVLALSHMTPIRPMPMGTACHLWTWMEFLVAFPRSLGNCLVGDFPILLGNLPELGIGKIVLFFESALSKSKNLEDWQAAFRSLWQRNPREHRLYVDQMDVYPIGWMGVASWVFCCRDGNRRVLRNSVSWHFGCGDL